MLLAIDPGYMGMGWALFEGRTKTSKLVKAGFFQERKKSTKVVWYRKVLKFQNYLHRELRLPWGTPIKQVVCEEIQVMDGPTGYAAARTSLMGLAGTVGMWAAWSFEIGATFHLAPIVQWKGQLPKAIVNTRIRKILTQREVKFLSKPASHDWDAAGIGLWYQGRF